MNTSEGHGKIVEWTDASIGHSERLKLPENVNRCKSIWTGSWDTSVGAVNRDCPFIKLNDACCVRVDLFPDSCAPNSFVCKIVEVSKYTSVTFHMRCHLDLDNHLHEFTERPEAPNPTQSYDDLSLLINFDCFVKPWETVNDMRFPTALMNRKTGKRHFSVFQYHSEDALGSVFFSISDKVYHENVCLFVKV